MNSELLCRQPVKGVGSGWGARLTESELLCRCLEIGEGYEEWLRNVKERGKKECLASSVGFLGLVLTFLMS